MIYHLLININYTDIKEDILNVNNIFHQLIMKIKYLKNNIKKLYNCFKKEEKDKIIIEQM